MPSSRPSKAVAQRSWATPFGLAQPSRDALRAGPTPAGGLKPGPRPAPAVGSTCQRLLGLPAPQPKELGQQIARADAMPWPSRALRCWTQSPAGHGGSAGGGRATAYQGILDSPRRQPGAVFTCSTAVGLSRAGQAKIRTARLWVCPGAHAPPRCCVLARRHAGAPIRRLKKASWRESALDPELWACTASFAIALRSRPPAAALARRAIAGGGRAGAQGKHGPRAPDPEQRGTACPSAQPSARVLSFAHFKVKGSIKPARIANGLQPLSAGEGRAERKAGHRTLALGLRRFGALALAARRWVRVADKARISGAERIDWPAVGGLCGPKSTALRVDRR